MRQEVKEYFAEKEVPVIQDPDQYSTDFAKCLKYVASRTVDIVAFGGLGGRADQAFAQLHQLYTASCDPNLSRGDVYLFTTESIIFLLRQGRNEIITPVEAEVFAENVGIIPLATPAIISTQGLEWDVTNWRTEFGTQVSTSNHIRQGTVIVETDERVLFTVELSQKSSVDL